MADVSANPPDTIPCPICQRPVPIPRPADTGEAAKFFPFCTERCKLVDLGRWLDGKYQIPVTEADEDDDMD